MRLASGHFSPPPLMDTWTDTNTGYPEPDAPVRFRTVKGAEHDGVLRLFDESQWPEGAHWETKDGERVELGAVTAWQRR